jgi:hypothetical protein
MKRLLSNKLSWFVALVFVVALSTSLVKATQFVYQKSASVAGTTTEAAASANKVQHMSTPEPVRAIYMTAYVADVVDWREKILKLIDDTEVNALVLDIKDYTGVLIAERAPDVEDFIKTLHEHDVYVIGRLSTFQDQKYVKEHPELAVKRKDNGEVWRDRKGIAWLDPGSEDVWKYVVGLARDAYAQGFDEINFDYIRFPSDGDMGNVSYTHGSATQTKADRMNEFYAYLSSELRTEGIPISADLFGMTTTNSDDLGIGQVLENALAHFDYVAPMVYPSHYPPTFNGWANPNKVPGELIYYVMNSAVEKAVAASSSPYKLRPWLQDFDYGGDYGEVEVRAQKQGMYDAGLTSWMLWDPGVKYTPSALDPA